MVTVNIYDGLGVGDYDNVVDFDILYNDDGNIDKATFKVQGSLNVKANDEIYFYDNTNTLQFRGKCKEKNPLNGQEIGIFELVCYTYDIELTEHSVDEVFTNIALETLAETIVTGYSSLSFSTTLSTGIIIKNYPADKKYAIDVMKMILGLSENLCYYIDYTTNTYVLFKKGDILSPISLENGSNCIFETDWNHITDKQVTRLNLIGGKETNQGFTETFSGTGSQTTFTTSYIFNNIKVSVGGVAKVLEVSGQNTGDYTVIPKDKQIIFNSAPASGTNNISVTYDWELPIDLRGVDADYSLIEKYGIIEKDISRPHLKHTDDAINYAYEYVNRFAEPLYGNTAIIIETLDARSILPGSLVFVKDSEHYIEDIIISQYFYVKEVHLTMSGLTITVGDTKNSILDFIKELKYQTEQLEQNNTNTSVTTKLQTISNSVNIDISSEIVSIVKRTINSDTFYLSESDTETRNLMNETTGPIMREDGASAYTDTTLL